MKNSDDGMPDDAEMQKMLKQLKPGESLFIGGEGFGCMEGLGNPGEMRIGPSSEAAKQSRVAAIKSELREAHADLKAARKRKNTREEIGDLVRLIQDLKADLHEARQ